MKIWLNSSVSDSRTPSALLPSTKELFDTKAITPRSPMRSDAHLRARKYESYKLFLFIPDDCSA